MRELIHNFPTFIILDIYDDSVSRAIDEWTRERLKELERAARASIVCPPENKSLKQHCRRTSEVASGVFVRRFKESIDLLIGEAEALSARSCFPTYGMDQNILMDVPCRPMKGPSYIIRKKIQSFRCAWEKSPSASDDQQHIRFALRSFFRFNPFDRSDRNVAQCDARKPETRQLHDVKKGK